MRAATVIVGAIAVSSCLIALALVLTSGNSGSVESAHRQPPRQQTTTTDTAGGDTGSAPASGPVQCNVEVTVEGGSCFLGKNVLAAYEETGSAALTAVDPESGEELEFECNGTAPTICGSAGGVVVYLAP
jgi:hypothetical protein